MKNNGTKDRKTDTYLFVRLPVTVKERLKERAQSKGCKQSVWVRQLIYKDLESD